MLLVQAACFSVFSQICECFLAKSKVSRAHTVTSTCLPGKRMALKRKWSITASHSFISIKALGRGWCPLWQLLLRCLFQPPDVFTEHHRTRRDELSKILPQSINRITECVKTPSSRSSKKEHFGWWHEVKRRVQRCCRWFFVAGFFRSSLRAHFKKTSLVSKQKSPLFSQTWNPCL